MRNLILFFAFIASIAVSAQEYIIEINDSTFEISLDENYNIVINGESVDFTVIAKDTLVYDDDFYSFKHIKDFRVSKVIVDEGIEQIMILTADGSGFLIQKYLTMNPTLMNDLMMNEVTKESVNYGFELKREDYSRGLTSGERVNVDKAVLTYNDEINIYEIATIGFKDSGILIMSMKMDGENSETGNDLINFMWDSLEIK